MKYPTLALILGALTAPAAAQTNLRAWAADGQTWLVWEDDLGLAETETFAVYRDDVPITDVADATLAGRLFPADWQAGRLALSAGPGATYSIPDGAGGTYGLAPNEAVFAYTSHGAGPEHFAVVRSGDAVPPAGAAVGPVAPSLDPVVPHAQHSGVDAGHPYTVYALWIDGDDDPEAGSAAFPVMGNASFDGIAQLFCVFEPPGGLPAGPLPAVVYLHGGDGSYWTYRPSKSAQTMIGLGIDDGLYVTVDDNWHLYWDVGAAASTPTIADDVGSRWFGFQWEFDRFESPTVAPSDDAVVVDTSMRRLDFVLDRLVDAHGVDPHRISMAGLSGGARGTLGYTRTRPERIAAATCFVPATGPLQVGVPGPFGAIGQGLATPFPGVTYDELFELTTLVTDTDLPPTRIVWGTQDALVDWTPVPALMAAIGAQARGAMLYWDERGHTAGSGTWGAAHFVGSPRFDMPWLTRYRNDRSYPAFFDVDHAVAAPGIQPLPEAPPGDPYGSWGGWLDWNPDTVVDTAGEWSAAIGVVGGSTFAGDVPPLATARASVTIRRPQTFELEPYQAFEWELVDVPGGALLADGQGVADGNGRPTVEGLLLDTTPARLVLRPLPATWTPLYGGVAGTLGLPELDALGGLATGAQVDLTLSSARPAAPAFLVIGAATLELPLFGGTLVPTLDLILPTFTDAAGTAQWSATLGAVPAAGLELWLQGWVLDPLAALGFAAGDALVGAQP